MEPLRHPPQDGAVEDLHITVIGPDAQRRDVYGRQRATALARSMVESVPVGGVIELEFPTTRPFARAAKRAIDVVGALLGLVLALPVLIVVAVLIRLDSPGDVIFAHDRIGVGGRRFRCYKLRTMCADAEARLDSDPQLREAHRANHFKLPAHADERITALGRFLRTTSLDEIPQFWNVVRGDMSLVGPRPVVADELVHYGTGRALLLSMRPGITGAWAVSGRSRIGYPQRAALELDYVRHWSFGTDVRILAQTVGVVLQRRGAY